VGARDGGQLGIEQAGEGEPERVNDFDTTGSGI
jgi:hypothetical protein